ncbi:MAG: hypothetical protein BWX48_03544 [Verrucomicrobia bacterium ADurb.Bin006]|nr:MAG: hypothetical protein BWX48_03544 [Verrucomicrobia bacterium ADurb.Bin006]
MLIDIRNIEIVAQGPVKPIHRQCRIHLVPVLPRGHAGRVTPSRHGVPHQPPCIANRAIVVAARGILQGVHVEIAREQHELEMQAVPLGCSHHLVQHEIVHRIVPPAGRTLDIGLPEQFSPAVRLFQRHVRDPCRATAFEPEPHRIEPALLASRGKPKTSVARFNLPNLARSCPSNLHASSFPRPDRLVH